MIALVGGTGRLGSRLADRLVRSRLAVRVVAREPDRLAPSLRSRVEVAAADVTEPSTLAAALSGCDTVVSAITGFGDPGAAGPRAVDREGNLALIGAAETARCARFVLVSVHRASETSPVELFRAKAAAEARLRTSRMAWTVVRPTAYLETWLEVVGRPLAEAGRARIFGSGTNPVNFVAVDDVAAIIERVVVDWPAAGQAITVAGPRNMSLNELAEEIEEVIGRPGRIDHVPRLVLRLGSALLGPIRPPVADLLRAALLMDRSDMRVDTANRLMWFPDVPVTGTDSVVARTFAGSGA